MIRRNLYRGQITCEEIQKAYEKAFGISWWAKFLSGLLGIWDFKFADQTYAEADIDKIREVIKQDLSDNEMYQAEGFDCDDFAFALMGAFHHNRDTAAMPIFVTWVLMPEGGHAVLSFYDKGNIKIIEPQNDEIYPVPKNWELILLCG